MTNPGLSFKRAMLMPGIAALALAATVSISSSTPLLTFLALILGSGAGVAIAILLMVEVRRPAKAPDELGLVYGGFWLRSAAYMIDVLTIGLPAAVLTAMNPSLIVLAYAVLPVYFVVLWATTGRTLAASRSISRASSAVGPRLKPPRIWPLFPTGSLLSPGPV